MGYTPSIKSSDIFLRKRREENKRKIESARRLYQQGMSLYEISERVNLPEGVLVKELGLG